MEPTRGLGAQGARWKGESSPVTKSSQDWEVGGGGGGEAWGRGERVIPRRGWGPQRPRPQEREPSSVRQGRGGWRVSEPVDQGKRIVLDLQMPDRAAHVGSHPSVSP